MTEEFVNRLKKVEKICHHFHLSLQSGCTETLKRMNRSYTAEDFMEAVRIIRANFEDVMLTADVIVGFPGETEEEFETTYKFLDKIKFYKIHVFKYSQRNNTKAASFPNQIFPEIKEERSKKIINLTEKIHNQYNESYIGKNLEVLVEEKHKGYYTGHTENFLCVNVQTSENDMENKIVKVLINGVENENLKGQMIGV